MTFELGQEVMLSTNHLSVLSVPSGPMRIDSSPLEMVESLLAGLQNKTTMADFLRGLQQVRLPCLSQTTHVQSQDVKGQFAGRGHYHSSTA